MADVSPEVLHSLTEVLVDPEMQRREDLARDVTWNDHLQRLQQSSFQALESGTGALAALLDWNSDEETDFLKSVRKMRDEFAEDAARQLDEMTPSGRRAAMGSFFPEQEGDPSFWERPGSSIMSTLMQALPYAALLGAAMVATALGAPAAAAIGITGLVGMALGSGETYNEFDKTIHGATPAQLKNSPLYQELMEQPGMTHKKAQDEMVKRLSVVPSLTAGAITGVMEGIGAKVLLPGLSGKAASAIGAKAFTKNFLQKTGVQAATEAPEEAVQTYTGSLARPLVGDETASWQEISDAAIKGAIGSQVTAPAAAISAGAESRNARLTQDARDEIDRLREETSRRVAVDQAQEEAITSGIPDIPSDRLGHILYGEPPKEPLYQPPPERPLQPDAMGALPVSPLGQDFVMSGVPAVQPVLEGSVEPAAPAPSPASALPVIDVEPAHVVNPHQMNMLNPRENPAAAVPTQPAPVLEAPVSEDFAALPAPGVADPALLEPPPLVTPAPQAELDVGEQGTLPFPGEPEYVGEVNRPTPAEVRKKIRDTKPKVEPKEEPVKEPVSKPVKAPKVREDSGVKPTEKKLGYPKSKPLTDAERKINAVNTTQLARAVNEEIETEAKKKYGRQGPMAAFVQGAQEAAGTAPSKPAPVTNQRSYDLGKKRAEIIKRRAAKKVKPVTTVEEADTYLGLDKKKADEQKEKEFRAKAEKVRRDKQQAARLEIERKKKAKSDGHVTSYTDEDTGRSYEITKSGDEYVQREIQDDGGRGEVQEVSNVVRQRHKLPAKEKVAATTDAVEGAVGRREFLRLARLARKDSGPKGAKQLRTELNKLASLYQWSAKGPDSDVATLHREFNKLANRPVKRAGSSETRELYNTFLSEKDEAKLQAMRKEMETGEVFSAKRLIDNVVDAIRVDQTMVPDSVRARMYDPLFAEEDIDILNDVFREFASADRIDTYNLIQDYIDRTDPSVFTEFLEDLLGTGVTGNVVVEWKPKEAFPGERPVIGRFKPRAFDRSAADFIELNEAYATDTRLMMGTLAHELMHAATIDRYESDPMFNRAIRAIHRDVLEYVSDMVDKAKYRGAEGLYNIAGSIDYGISDTREFLAEMFVNPHLRSLLEQMPARNKRNWIVTAFDAFIDAIRKFLGGKPTQTYHNMMERIVAQGVLRSKRQLSKDKRTSKLNHSNRAPNFDMYKEIIGDYGDLEEFGFGVSRTNTMGIDAYRTDYPYDYDPFSNKPDLRVIEGLNNFGSVLADPMKDFVQELSLQGGAINSPLERMAAAATGPNAQRMQSHLKAMTDKTRKVLHRFISVRQIDDWYSGLLPEDSKFRKAMKKMVKFHFLREDFVKRMQRRADIILGYWAKAEGVPFRDVKLSQYTNEAEAMAHIQIESTYYEVFPDKPWNDPAHDHHRKMPVKPMKPENRDKRIAKQNAARLAHKELSRVYNKLSTDTKATHHVIERFYNDERARMFHLIRHNMIEAYNKANPNNKLPSIDPDKIGDGPTYKEFNDKNGIWFNNLDKDTYGTIKRTFTHARLQGPYFPLRRFGEYVVVADVNKTMTFADEDEYSTYLQRNWGSKAIKQHPVRADGSFDVDFEYSHVEFFDKMADADARHRALQNEEGVVNLQKVSKRAQYVHQQRPLQHKVYQGVMGNIQDNPDLTVAEREKMRSIWQQVAMSFMPDNTSLKSELRRQKIAGASRDMKRAFAMYSMSSSNLQASLRYASTISEQIADMNKALKESYKNPDSTDDPIMLDTIVATLTEHDKRGADPIVIPWYVQRLSDFGFVNFLASPSYWMINSMQPGMYAYPLMASKYGSAPTRKAMMEMYGKMMPEIWGRTGKRFASSAGDVFKRGEIKKGFEEFFSSPETYNITEEIIKNLKTGGAEGVRMANALEKLGESGLVDLTFVMDLRREAGGDIGSSDPYKRGMQIAMDVTRLMPHMVEIMNRTVTGLSAYKLAYDAQLKKGKTAAQANTFALEEAANMIALSQFDYSSANRPLAFQGRAFPLIRTALMFKMHPQGVYYMMLKMMRAALTKGGERGQHGYSREDAWRALGWIGGTHMLTAGAVGAMFEPIKWMLGLGALMFGEEGEDIEQLLERWSYDMLGPTLGEAVSHGLPAAMGIDLSGRLGMHNLAVYTRGAGAGRQDRQDFYSAVSQAVGGPIFTYLGSAYEGIDDIAYGDVGKGIAKIVPQPFRGAVNAYNLGDPGLMDRNGMVIYDTKDMHPVELFLRQAAVGMGLPLTEVNKVYRRRNIAYYVDGIINDKRKQLLRRAREADRGVWSDIGEFNRMYPDYRITGRTVSRSRKSARERQTNIRRNQGVYIADDKREVRRRTAHYRDD